MSEAKNKIIKSRTTLLIDAPFYGSLLLYPRLSERSDIATMATDGKDFFYNKDFVSSLKFKELNFILMHEVFHCIFEHSGPFRMGHRTALIYNEVEKKPYPLYYIAADYVINDILTTDNSISNKIEMPKYKDGKVMGLLDSRFHNMCTEQVYDILLAELEANPNVKKVNMSSEGVSSPEGFPDHMGIVPAEGDGDKFKPHDSHDKFSGKKNNETKEIVEQWKERVQKSATQAKIQGNLPSGIERIMDYLFAPPKINWRDALKDFIMNMFKSSYRFIPPNRKYLPSNIVLPSVSGEYINVGFFIDTSGSMGGSELAMAINELTNILMNFDGYSIHVIGCDASVHGYKEFTTGETIDSDFSNIKDVVKGGGGTDFCPPFKYIQDEGIKLDAAVYFTDGYGTFPEQEDVDTQVIWLRMEKNSIPESEFPFGRVITIYEDQV